MNDSFSILFYPKRNDANKRGQAPLYMRITVDGRRTELSIRRKVDIAKWDTSKEKMRGNTPELREVNSHMSNIRMRILKLYDKLIDEDRHVTAVMLKDTYLGKKKPEKMLLEVFQEHNNQVEQLVGQDFAAGTAERYRTAKKHLAEYIKHDYKKDDIPIQDVNHKFITGFEYYLKAVRKCSHNTAIKYVVNFKKIIRIAYANDWITKDPFVRWKVRLKNVEREYLSREEIDHLLETNFHTLRLEQVRDIFVFCCFTGLAYADVKKLSKEDINKGIDGELWINTSRTKTKSKANIPILPTAQAILNKHAYSPDLKNDRVLPVLTNQKMNAYLKEIAHISGIKKNLTTHLARHTFATTVTLSNGVSIESVSKMLGHKNLRTTQHYAKILNKRVSQDMQMLRDKLKTKDVLQSTK
ncbi:site-specific integrase [Flavobacteriaceae bacterium TP-CH-4]|uniref:Site-specific integrase n=1 Tax=Pelagihabitans pacificus TaxID=2696054 RepID=A0A967AUC5_9FLAO|nr:site-specific integrase [Pelagihabitans pacificus]NHF59173.1 site-specific integrase [Pelagihabitans pacificus]